MSKDPDLLSQFSPVNQDIISESGSPLSPKAGWYEGPKEVVKKFQIHHVKPIKDGGAKKIF
ncbi:HNH endonuclease signature motif containing protein [Salmonella enterica]